MQPLPPFITSEFMLDILLALGGKATGPQIRDYVKANYSGWTENTFIYLSGSLRTLQKNRYVDVKRNFREHGSQYVYSIRDEVRPMISAAR